MPELNSAPNIAIRPLDVLVLAKIVVAQRGERVRQMDLASSLQISQASVSQSLKRLAYCGLMNDRGEPRPQAVEEFFVHGLKYMMPGKLSGLTRGMATAHGASPLKSKIRGAADDLYVWPDADGDARGQALTPVHESAPWASKRDPKLYEFLALVDALRVGRAREVEIAKRELHSRIAGVK